MLGSDPVIIRLKGGAAAYNLDLGFIPTYAEVTVLTASYPTTYRWFGEEMEDSAEALASSWEYGIKHSPIAAIAAHSDNDGGEAALQALETYMATVATGISAYDGAKTPRVRIPAPNGNGFVEADVYGDWDATVDYDSVGTDRSTTVAGTIIRPPIHNGKVFELLDGVATAASEPTTGWDVEPGVTVTDGGTNDFICRIEDIVSAKGKGITLGGTLLESDKIVYVVAWRNGHFRDIGDIG